MSRRPSPALLIRLPAAALLGLALASVAPAVSSAPPKVALLSAPSTSTPAPRKGVVVVAVGAVGDAADAAWPVASAVYADGAVRGKIVDRDARVLAGGKLPDDASDDLKELAELRAKVAGDDAASRAVLKEIARRTSTLAVVVVFPTQGDVPSHARVYDAADDRMAATEHKAEKGSSPWAPLVSALHAKYASEPAKAPPPKDAPKPKEEPSRSFWSSPWFWGAVGAAVAGAAVAYAVTRDSGNQTTPVRVDWSGK